MNASSVAGIVFANIHDELLSDLTANRSMASVPFGGRYRLIDFSLSNLVNADITNVGLITRENYRSLLDHVGSGIYWDLDRKTGGLHLMPPYNFGGLRRHASYIDSLYGGLDFVRRSNADHIVICNSDVIANVDIAGAVKAHKDSEADITVVYTGGVRPANHSDLPVLKLSGNEVTEISLKSSSDDCNYGIGITVFSKKAIFDTVERGYDENDRSLFETVRKTGGDKKIIGFKHNGFVSVMDNGMSYFDANMQLLNREIRNDLFSKERPILTKTRDDMPTRYGTKSVVNNCFIADGCIIDGTVRNSILFRGVKVEKGAVIENSILMQGTAVGSNSQVEYVISDKNAVIGADTTVKGTVKKPFFIKKNQSL